MTTLPKQLVMSDTEIREKYHELLYAVGNKTKGESRHQTALRYIIKAELPNDMQCQAAAIKQQEGKK